MKALKIAVGALAGLYAIVQGLRLVGAFVGASAYVLPRLLLICLAGAASALLLSSVLRARRGGERDPDGEVHPKESHSAGHSEVAAQARPRRSHEADDIERELDELKKRAARRKAGRE